jgi:hypothetical protein
LIRLDDLKCNFGSLAIDPITFPNFEAYKFLVEANVDGELILRFLVVSRVNRLADDLVEVIEEFEAKNVMIVSPTRDLGDSLVDGDTCIW